MTQLRYAYGKYEITVQFDRPFWRPRYFASTVVNEVYVETPWCWSREGAIRMIDQKMCVEIQRDFTDVDQELLNRVRWSGMTPREIKQMQRALLAVSNGY